MAQSAQKVCIIGAGPNGLMSARHVAECPNTEVTIFEANSEVGGLWAYEEKNNADPKFEEEKKQDTYYQLYNQFYTSLYPSLQSNLPYFFMAYKDLSHADIIKDVSSFIDITQHKTYLNAYADKFNLKNKVIFNTLVKSVRLYDNLSPEQQSLVPEKRKFAVTTANAKGGDLEAGVRVHAFDYVLICTGCNVIPYIPPVKGMEKFEGKVLTVKSFREPTSEFFTDKKVMVLGTGMSSVDMIIKFCHESLAESQSIKHMTLVGREVGGSQRSQDFAPFRESGKLRVLQGEIKEVVGPNTIKLTDESEHEIDTLLLCTGYQLHFPFLDFEKDKIIDHPRQSFLGKFIGPLYKRIVSVREPSLFFVGFLDSTPLATWCHEAQGLFVKAIIEGKYKLPSQNEMFQSFLNDKDDLQWNQKRPMNWYFRLTFFNFDLKYLEDIKSILRKIYSHDEEKAREFNDALMATLNRMIEFLGKGNSITYRKQDFHDIFSRTLRDTTEFI